MSRVLGLDSADWEECCERPGEFLEKGGERA